MWNTHRNSDSSWVDGTREVLHEAEDRARGYGSIVTNQIKAHPLVSAGIAFAVGFILAGVARRHTDAR